jgi:hypothetical protein
MYEHPMEAQSKRYETLLLQVKVRHEFANSALAGPTLDWRHVEIAALNLRKVIELVALGGLVSNLAEVRQVSSAFDRQNWNQARKLLRQVNPRFWPVPSRQTPGEGRADFELVDVTEPYLTEEEAGKAFGVTSELLHATNPFRPEPDIGVALISLQDISRKVSALLSHHHIFFTDKRFMAIALMNGSDPVGSIQVSLWTVVE